MSTLSAGSVNSDRQNAGRVYAGRVLSATVAGQWAAYGRANGLAYSAVDDRHTYTPGSASQAETCPLPAHFGSRPRLYPERSSQHGSPRATSDRARTDSPRLSNHGQSRRRLRTEGCGRARLEDVEPGPSAAHSHRMVLASAVARDHGDLVSSSRLWLRTTRAQARHPWLSACRVCSCRSACCGSGTSSPKGAHPQYDPRRGTSGRTAGSLDLACARVHAP